MKCNIFPITHMTTSYDLISTVLLFLTRKMCVRITFVVKLVLAMSRSTFFVSNNSTRRVDDKHGG